MHSVVSGEQQAGPEAGVRNQTRNRTNRASRFRQPQLGLTPTLSLSDAITIRAAPKFRATFMHSVITKSRPKSR
jgi:hypothetical protein